ACPGSPAPQPLSHGTWVPRAFVTLRMKDLRILDERAGREDDVPIETRFAPARKGLKITGLPRFVRVVRDAIRARRDDPVARGVRPVEEWFSPAILRRQG